MLIIRLQRVGRTNDPSFRVIVTDSKNAAKTGNFLEIVGSYDARQGKPELKVERIKYWLEHGAQVSATVHNLLVKAGVIAGQIINQIPVKKETATTPEATKAEETATVTASAPEAVVTDTDSNDTAESSETPAAE